jgi:hypothetical protein
MTDRLYGTVNPRTPHRRGEDAMNEMLDYGLLDETLDAYAEWLEECAAVRDAYRWWLDAPHNRKSAAFDDYLAALDNEQHTAELYAHLYGQLVHHVRECASKELGRPYDSLKLQ